MILSRKRKREYAVPLFAEKSRFSKAYVPLYDAGRLGCMCSTTKTMAVFNRIVCLILLASVLIV